VRTEEDSRTIPAKGLVVCTGSSTQTQWLKDVVELDERGYIRIDTENMTSVPGVFAAGDVSTIQEKQIVISAGEGAKVANRVYAYLRSREGKPNVVPPDWGQISS